jgi:hypothetical protein
MCRARSSFGKTEPSLFWGVHNGADKAENIVQQAVQFCEKSMNFVPEQINWEQPWDPWMKETLLCVARA